MSTYPSEKTLEKLWKSRMIMLEVLSDRKYPIECSDFIEYEDFKEWTGNSDESTIREDMTLQYEKSTDDKIMVIWPNENKLGTNIREIVKKLGEQDVSRAIIVINDSVTNWCKGLIRRLHIEKKYIDVYTLDESQYNLMKHVLVPKHRICSKKEKKSIMSSYSVKQDSIPQIKSIDPVVRHFGAKRGQLFEIIRISDTQPDYKSVTYRIVA